MFEQTLQERSDLKSRACKKSEFCPFSNRSLIYSIFLLSSSTNSAYYDMFQNTEFEYHVFALYGKNIIRT